MRKLPEKEKEKILFILFVLNNFFRTMLCEYLCETTTTIELHILLGNNSSAINFKLGILLNFGTKSLTYKRMVDKPVE